MRNAANIILKDESENKTEKEEKSMKIIEQVKIVEVLKKVFYSETRDEIIAKVMYEGDIASIEVPLKELEYQNISLFLDFVKREVQKAQFKKIKDL